MRTIVFSVLLLLISQFLCAADSQIELIVVKGNVQLKNKEWSTLYQDDKIVLSKYSRFKTDVESTCVLSYSNGTKITLGPSTYVLSDFEEDKLICIKGSLRVEAKGEPVKIETLSARIEAKKSVFETLVKEAKTILNVKSGSAVKVKTNHIVKKLKVNYKALVKANGECVIKKAEG